MAEISDKAVLSSPCAVSRQRPFAVCAKKMQPCAARLNSKKKSVIYRFALIFKPSFSVLNMMNDPMSRLESVPRGRSVSPSRWRVPRSERRSLSIGRARSPSRRTRSMDQGGEEDQLVFASPEFNLAFNPKQVEEEQVEVEGTCSRTPWSLGRFLMVKTTPEEEKESLDSCSPRFLLRRSTTIEDVEIEPSEVSTNCSMMVRLN
jgi:hypothetical protein